MFTDDEQSVLLAFLQGILPHCATVHHIIDGNGFAKSTRLAIVTKLSVSTSRPRAFYTHQTIEEGIRSIKALYGVDLSGPAHSSSEAPPERASSAFREAARIAVGGGRAPAPPRKGS